MFRAAFYKGTHAGLPGIYNRLVRWWTTSPYSHVEMAFSDGWSASSSWMDGGVRFKQIDFDPAKWDFVELPAALEGHARVWFEMHNGDAYDVMGNLHFIVPPIHDLKCAWSCAEAFADALGVDESWRYYPGLLPSTLSLLFK